MLEDLEDLYEVRMKAINHLLALQKRKKEKKKSEMSLKQESFGKVICRKRLGIYGRLFYKMIKIVLTQILSH
jgi:hypothetical protein